MLWRGTARQTCQYRKKLAIDEWPWHTHKVITIAAIKWPYGISLPVCGLLFQHQLRRTRGPSVFGLLQLLWQSFLRRARHVTSETLKLFNSQPGSQQLERLHWCWRVMDTERSGCNSCEQSWRQWEGMERKMKGIDIHAGVVHSNFSNMVVPMVQSYAGRLHA